MTSKSQPSNKPEQYIADVLNGKQIVSKWVRQTIERHVRDLAEGPFREKPIKFSPEMGLRVIAFIEQFVPRVEDERAGEPWIVEPWIAALLYILYGWSWADTGLRRFKFAYVEISRGNLKSTLASALCLYELISTQGASVYTAATDAKAARVVFDTAAQQVRLSPHLKRRIGAFRSSLFITETASKCEPCSADKKSIFAASRPSFVVLDELHMHDTNEVWRTFATALGKRQNSMMFAITNSGWDRHSICYQQREYTTRVLDGSVPDDSWFGWVCGLDVEDLGHWDEERNWIKANPSLGVAVSLDFLRTQAKKAKESPAELNETLRFHFSVWTESITAWMPMEAWDQCSDPVNGEALKRRPCFGGLDLSTTKDISAFVLLFPPYGEDKLWRVLPHFFLPKDNITQRVQRDRVPYDVWERKGLFQLTDGNILDYDFIRAKVNQLAEKYQILEIAFDPYNATQIVTQLQTDGMTMVNFRQGDVSMTAPLKRLLELVLTKELAHGANPVMRWMAGNVVVKVGPTGLMKPDKEKSREKIDGIVALLNALGRAMTYQQETVGMFFA